MCWLSRLPKNKIVCQIILIFSTFEEQKSTTIWHIQVTENRPKQINPSSFLSALNIQEDKAVLYNGKTWHFPCLAIKLSCAKGEWLSTELQLDSFQRAAAEARCITDSLNAFSYAQTEFW